MGFTCPLDCYCVEEEKGVIQYCLSVPEDVPQILDLNHSFFEDGLERLSEKDLNLCVVAKEEGRLIGYQACGVRRQFSFDRNFRLVKAGLLWSIAVQPEYRRRGIGKTLILKAVDALKEKGCSEFFMIVRESQPAIPLYNSCGFYTWKTLNRYYSDGENAFYLVRAKRTCLEACRTLLSQNPNLRLHRLTLYGRFKLWRQNHFYLVDQESGEVVDPTASQFDFPLDYSKGVIVREVVRV